MPKNTIIHKGENTYEKVSEHFICLCHCRHGGGVFYREFTKFNHFTGVTTLGKVHPHLFLLGMLTFLVLALYAAHNDLTKIKTFRVFLWTYNIGVPLTAVMMVVRGVPHISGIAGIGHIQTGVGIVLLLLSLRKIAKD